MQRGGRGREAEIARRLRLAAYKVLTERGASLSPAYWDVIEDKLIRPAVPRVLQDEPFRRSIEEAEDSMGRVVSELVEGEYPLDTFDRADASEALGMILDRLCPGFWPFC